MIRDSVCRARAVLCERQARLVESSPGKRRSNLSQTGPTERWASSRVMYQITMRIHSSHEMKESCKFGTDRRVPERGRKPQGRSPGERAGLIGDALALEAFRCVSGQIRHHGRRHLEAAVEVHCDAAELTCFQNRDACSVSNPNSLAILREMHSVGSAVGDGGLGSSKSPDGGQSKIGFLRTGYIRLDRSFIAVFWCQQTVTLAVPLPRPYETL